MTYSAILIDVSNLFYRIAEKETSSKNAALRIINWVENEAINNLDKDGTIWLLFDHLSYDSDNVDRGFQNGIIRNDVKIGYKKGRKHSKIFGAAIELVRKYFYYSGPQFKLVYGEKYEADDFVHAILIKHPEYKEVAFVTTDEDWTRYMNDHTVLINAGFNKPWKESDFEDKYKFKPTEATVILYKALFGDSSDNIRGALFASTAKFSDEMGFLCLSWLQELGNNKTPYEEAKKMLLEYDQRALTAKSYENLSLIEKVCYQFMIIGMRSSNEQALHTNIKLLESLVRPEQLAKYTYGTEEKDERFEIIKNSIKHVPLKNRLGGY